MGLFFELQQHNVPKKITFFMKIHDYENENIFQSKKLEKSQFYCFHPCHVAQWNLLSQVANMVSSLVLCTPRQTFLKFLIVIKSCTTRRMAEWFKALCYYHFARYDAGSILGQGFSAFLHFLQISQTFRGNICFQETIGNTKLFALIVAVLNYLQMLSCTTAHCGLLRKLSLEVSFS